jgi:hypothetical protein
MVLLRTALVIGLVFGAFVEARAQELITDNDFNIDAVTGPVLGSSRIVGMGGAYTAIADGIAGAAWNPASFASRYNFELDWWDWDLALSLFGPGVFGQEDFFNNGKGVGAEAFWFINAGLRLQFGRLGFGFDFRTNLYQMTVGDEAVNITLLEGHTGVAWAFWEGQLVAGLGARGADLDMTLPDAPEDDQELIHFTDAGLEAGVLLRLADQPWRIGVAARLPVEAKAETEDNVVTDANGVKSIRGFILPRRVYMPWEVQLGFAWQFGDRRFNQKWEEPRDVEEELGEKVKFRRCWRMEEQLRIEAEKKGEPLPPEELCPDLDDEPEDEAWWEREEKIREEEDEQLDRAVDEEEERIYWARRRWFEADSRNYWLVSTELLLVGTTEKGVGMDAFLEQEHREAGKEISVGFRIGAETEPWANRMKVRAGFYLEPPRGVLGDYRPHGTVGFDVRLFRWDLWGLFHPFDITIGMTGDFAPRYVDLGIGVGFWH